MGVLSPIPTGPVSSCLDGVESSAAQSAASQQVVRTGKCKQQQQQQPSIQESLALTARIGRLISDGGSMGDM